MKKDINREEIELMAQVLLKKVKEEGKDGTGPEVWNYVEYYATQLDYFVGDAYAIADLAEKMWANPQ